MAGPVGRPRKRSSRRRGSNAREEILDASAELFTNQGFAMTSTHQIAEAVGMRQASLYYHFPSKTEIFLTLLKSTVEPSLAMAARLAESEDSAAQRLWSLVAAQARELLGQRWNVGKLYQLPVANSTEFAEYHASRKEVEKAFRNLATEIVGPDDARVELPFPITLSVCEMRNNDGVVPAPLSTDSLPERAVMLADAVLNVLQAPLPGNREARTLELLSTEE